MFNLPRLFFSITTTLFSSISLANTPISQDSPLTSSVQCSISINGDLMYARFYSLWIEDAGIENGYKTGKTKNINSQEKSEALDCLKKADALNNCAAIQVLELSYRFGKFGIKKDLMAADKYLERKKLACTKNSIHSDKTQ